MLKRTAESTPRTMTVTKDGIGIAFRAIIFSYMNDKTLITNQNSSEFTGRHGKNGRQHRQEAINRILTFIGADAHIVIVIDIVLGVDGA